MEDILSCIIGNLGPSVLGVCPLLDAKGRVFQPQLNATHTTKLLVGAQDLFFWNNCSQDTHPQGINIFNISYPLYFILLTKILRPEKRSVL